MAKNEIIRDARYEARMNTVEIAELLGVSESTFYRWMRREMPVNRQKEIAELIKSARKE